MKRIVIIAFLLGAFFSVNAQPSFDLGIKGGINTSKVTTNFREFDSESIVKSHFGAFARIGYNRVYVQPEVYFIAKGGEVSSSLLETLTKFDFNNVDVPILLGVRVLNGSVGNFRVMAGPVFSFVTSGNVIGDERLTADYFRDRYHGYQYGVGFDIWNFFLDARIERGANNMYVYPNDPYLRSKNRTFMVTLGFKIL